MLLVEKYRPRKLDDLIGNEEPRQKLKTWILNWMHGTRRKPLLIHGPVGIGKTALALALADEFQLELIEVNASMLRNRNAIERMLSAATMASSLFGRTKLLLVDDADIFEKHDRGGIAALASLLREASYPFILTATDPWDKKLAPIRLLCEMIPLRRPSTPSLQHRLSGIAEKENIPIPAEALRAIAENAQGDVRSALNDLQSGRFSVRERETDIFHRLRIIFKSMSYADAAAVSQGDMDYDTLKLWIDENIPAEYSQPRDLAYAFNCLSRADIFEGRIRKSHWVLLRYGWVLLTAGIALSKKEPYRKFTKYQFPVYLKEMSSSISRRALRKSLCAKIGSRTHTSIRDSQAYLPLLQWMASENGAALRSFYQLEEEELAYLLETSVDRVTK